MCMRYAKHEKHLKIALNGNSQLRLNLQLFNCFFDAVLSAIKRCRKPSAHLRLTSERRCRTAKMFGKWYIVACEESGTA
jgi:hypothetical protein